MMLTREFLNKLRGKINYTLPSGHLSPSENLLNFSNRINVWKGTRHENLAQAKTFLRENNLQKLEDFEKIIVLIRNPYDYIVSRFHYLSKNQQYNLGPAARIAAEGDFEKYALKAPRFFRTEGYLLDEHGRIPENLHIIRYEDFSTTLNISIKKYLKEEIDFGDKVNFSKRKHYSDYYISNPEIEPAVYKKFKFLFDKGYYSRIVI